jgi:hypothetical protein
MFPGTTFFIFVLLLAGQNIFSQVDDISSYGDASYYHDKFLGRKTSSGERYNDDDFTAAHKTIPFNTILLVTNKNNNKSIVVRINDRGPFIKSRVIDLSHAAAEYLEMEKFGIVPVKLTNLNFLNPAIMNDTLFNEGDTWDCYGNKKTLSDTAIFFWRTESWKHAFYMASCLSLEFNLNSLYVYVSGKPKNRKYNLLVSDIENQIVIKVLLAKFKSSGFSHTKTVYNFGKASKLHDDRLPK